MVIGQLGARGHAALPTVGLDNGGGQGHVTTRSPRDSDKIASALHRNSQPATSKNVLVRKTYFFKVAFCNPITEIKTEKFKK